MRVYPFVFGDWLAVPLASSCKGPPKFQVQHSADSVGMCQAGDESFEAARRENAAWRLWHRQRLQSEAEDGSVDVPPVTVIATRRDPVVFGGQH